MSIPSESAISSGPCGGQDETSLREPARASVVPRFPICLNSVGTAALHFQVGDMGNYGSGGELVMHKEVEFAVKDVPEVNEVRD